MHIKYYSSKGFVDLQKRNIFAPAYLIGKY